MKHLNTEIARAKQIVAACSYPGGRDLERLRDLESGSLDDEVDDPVLRVAIREAAWNELFAERDSSDEQRGDHLRDQATDRDQLRGRT